MGDFQRFVQAIVDGDLAAVGRMLQAGPELATVASSEGATRQESKRFFIVRISHNLYVGDTALHMAAAAHNPEMVKLLLRAGAKVNATNRRGATPLHYACDGGPPNKDWNAQAQADTIEALCKAGANVNASNMDGASPLHRAVRTRCSLAVRTLLAAGADPDLRNKSGSTPLMLAGMATGRGGSGSPESKREQAAILKMLG